MHVGIFVDHFDPQKGGMETALAQLARHLEARGDDVAVYCLSAAADAPGRHVVIDGVPTRRGEQERQLAARSLEQSRADGCHVTLAVRHCPSM